MEEFAKYSRGDHCDGASQNVGFRQFADLDLVV